jgi:UDP-2-acetamido-2,6-beta-L-arabino-hexul-4-ose reductase
MRVLVTGADGFIAKNLIVRLEELKCFDILRFSRDSNIKSLASLVLKADIVIHLAGVNRPQIENEFFVGNTELTKTLCVELTSCNKNRSVPIPVIFSSSVQANDNSAYGMSKLLSEKILQEYAKDNSALLYIYRLPNVFGKWCKPNYNSVVATFCHNVINGKALSISDPSRIITLVYIDDVLTEFIKDLKSFDHSIKFVRNRDIFRVIPIQYDINLSDLAAQINAFKNGRNSLITERVGLGLARALYSTYVSFFSVNEFSYFVPKNEDSRGIFVEMLKTKDSGQFSFFTAHSGITRGGHYHHSKTEKFLVIKGKAKFRFKHILSNILHEISVTGEIPQIVETVPGWAHDITNIGDDELVVMLWANEIFDRDLPDTIACEIDSREMLCIK